MTRLLLVEDDASLGSTLTERLTRESYVVRWARTLREALDQIERETWDLVVLDLGLPDGSGFTLARKLKRISSVPIVFITALNSAENRLAGFEMGAEEFIPKPFHLKELLLRIRRVTEAHPRLRVVACGSKRIDIDAISVVHGDGRREYPAARDFRVLQLLIESSPGVVSRDRILSHAWGKDKFPSTRTVDNAIVRLRQMLEDDDGRFIRSVRGIGYQWIAGKGSSDE